MAKSLKKEKKKPIPVKKVLLALTILLCIGYLVYVAILITGVKKNDPLSENGSSSFLLSDTSFDDLDKTLWVFEEGLGSDSKITDAFLVASNKEKTFLLNIYIPGWIYFEAGEEDFGNSLTVSNFKYAGDFLEEGRGVEYAIWQFEQMLGTKIDHYIWIGEEDQSLYSKAFGVYRDAKGDFGYNSSEEDFTPDALVLDSFVSNFHILKIPLHPGAVSAMGKRIKSDSSLFDILGIISSTKSRLSGYDKHILDTGSGEYVKEELSTAGGVAYYFSSAEYDESFRKYLLNILDRDLEKEQVKVEVYNGSGISGAAGQMARKIENSGCDVVRYENAPDLSDHTILYVPDTERFKNSLSVVKEVVGTNVEVINERPEFMTTGDIVIVLGGDIERMYSF